MTATSSIQITYTGTAVAFWIIHSNGNKASSQELALLLGIAGSLGTVSIELPLDIDGHVIPPSSEAIPQPIIARIEPIEVPCIIVSLAACYAYIKLRTNIQFTETLRPAQGERTLIETIIPTLTMGASYQWFQAIFQLADDLVQRRLIMPTVDIHDTQLLARWSPLLVPQQAPYIDELAARMPSVTHTSNLQAHAVTHTILAQIVNHLVQQQLEIAHEESLTTAEQTLAFAFTDSGWISATPECLLLAEHLHSWNNQINDRLILRDIKHDWRIVLVVQYIEQTWQVTVCVQWHEDPNITIPITNVDKLLRKESTVSTSLHGDISYLYDTVSWLQKKFPWLTSQSNPTDEQLQLLLTQPDVLSKVNIGLISPPIKHKRLELLVDATSPAGISLQEIVNFRWQLAIDHKPITPQQFNALVNEQRLFIAQEGELIMLEPAQIRRLRSINSAATRPMHMIELVKMALNRHINGIPIERLQLPTEVEEILTRLQHPPTTYDIPTTLQSILRPYQVIGYQWLRNLRDVHFGALLADDMGLGKTIQVIAVLLATSAERTKPVLIIAPLSVMATWQEQLALFAPMLTVTIYHGTQREVPANNIDIILTTYATAAQSCTKQTALSQLEFDTIVLDEAQMIKNYQTDQSKAIKLLRAEHRIALTGTPIENRLQELWSIIDFCNHGYLGNLQQFNERYVIPITVHHDQQASTELSKLLAPFILRRTKDDESVIQGLPKKQETTILCRLNDTQTAIYQSIVDSIMEQLHTPGQKAPHILSAIVRLKQVCDDIALVQDIDHLHADSGKLRKVVPLLRKLLAQQRKVLIFTQFATFARLLHTYLQDQEQIDSLVMTGSCTASQRKKILQQFATSDTNVLIASLKTGGVGLNIMCASAVIHIDRWWNPAVERQATDRTYRIGQQQDVDVYIFITQGTIEEKIDRLLAHKKLIAATIESSMQKTIAQLSLQELKELFSLERT